MTKRRTTDLDLNALVLANQRFKDAHSAFMDVHQRIAEGQDVDPDEGANSFGAFMASALHLFTTSNTLVKASNALERSAPKLIVPGA